jgi:hypothetical protein
MVNRSRGRAGKTNLGCVLVLVIVGAIAYFAYNLGSAALHYFQYQDAMAQEARFAQRTSDDTIVAHLSAKADSLGLPPEAKKVHVSRKANFIWIWAEYTEEVELPGFVRIIPLAPHAERAF